MTQQLYQYLYINEEIFNDVKILNSDIPLVIADIHGRHLPLTETSYDKVWEGYDERPTFNSANFNKEDNAEIQKSCPTNAINDNGTIDLDKCFGCGLCVYLTKDDTYTMNLGSVDVEIENKNHSIPITCRQSDIQRGKKISSKLKQLIIDKEFVYKQILIQYYFLIKFKSNNFIQFILNLSLYLFLFIL